MLTSFHKHWSKVPTVWIDTETTGARPGRDKAVSVAIVRFEGGRPIDSFGVEVDPGIPIPPEATAIHGITDAMVQGKKRIEEVFALPGVQTLLAGAQPAAYNAPFDRHFVPPFGEDWTWPWLDCLSLVRVVDRFVRGKGRHKLAVVAQRHGIAEWKAHDSLGDATAAGLLFHKLIPQIQSHDCDRQLHEMTLGELLRWQRDQESNEWYRFTDWRARQPPMETA